MNQYGYITGYKKKNNRLSFPVILTAQFCSLNNLLNYIIKMCVKIIWCIKSGFEHQLTSSYPLLITVDIILNLLFALIEFRE